MLFVNIEKIISARPTKRACILQRQVPKVPTFIWKATPTFWFKLGKSLSKTNKGGKGGRVIPGLLQQSLGEILLPGRKGWDGGLSRCNPPYGVTWEVWSTTALEAGESFPYQGAAPYGDSASQVDPVVRTHLPMQETSEMWVQSPGISSGVGNGNSLQYSCLENPMDREA